MTGGSYWELEVGCWELPWPVPRRRERTLVALRSLRWILPGRRIGVVPFVHAVPAEIMRVRFGSDDHMLGADVSPFSTPRANDAARHRRSPRAQTMPTGPARANELECRGSCVRASVKCTNSFSTAKLGARLRGVRRRRMFIDELIEHFPRFLGLPCRLIRLPEFHEDGVLR
jgi:hypothetical protein